MPPRCRTLRQLLHANSLGMTFAQKFANNTSQIGTGEIGLFRAMQKSLVAVANPPHVVVEEYHGASHQVTFAGSGTYSRVIARCELSDLLIVIYDRQTRDARLSYIQAKSERSVRSTVNGIAGSLLAANLEQWDLLARRPRVAGVGSFNPPPDLLQSAMLDSVGSFAFFIQGSSGVEVQYAVASHLQRSPHCVSRYGSLRAPPDACHCGPTPECLSVYGNSKFGAFLFGLMIGTPILLRGKPATPHVCSWLAAQLKGFAAGALGGGRRAGLAAELADLLDPNRSEPAQRPSVGARTLMLFGV